MNFSLPIFLILASTILFSGCLTPAVRYTRPSMDANYQPSTKSRAAAVPAKKAADPVAASPKRAPITPSMHQEESPAEDSLDFGEARIPLSAEDSAARPDVVLAGDEGDLQKIVEHYMGTHYRAGGTTEAGMDCSGFVWRVFNTLGVKDFPRQSSADMMRLGRTVDLDEGRPGDLVYFRKRGRIYHVGIYMGEHRFAHSSSTLGVMYSNLDEEYFHAHYAGLRRVMP